MARDLKHVGIGWTVGVPSGWGTYGSSLAIELARTGIEPAIFLFSPEMRLPPAQLELLRPAILKHQEWRAAAARGNLALDFPLLVALGDGLAFADMVGGARGRPYVGVPFFESAVIPAKNLEDAKRFDLIVAGSTWNADVLARHGVANVRTCLQGVDLAAFKPRPKTDRFAGRFVVFSGGKLEYRKGQDLVVAAFKRFHERHDDALLLTAWHNPWPQIAKGLSVSPHVVGPPQETAEGGLDIPGWLRANGLPDSSFIDVGVLVHAQTPAVLREADLAVFPNRCEGGTNLVAMEAMACGLPVVLSRNTGHLDLIREHNCYSLDLQIPIGEVTGKPAYEGWGESVIEDLVAKMEQAYGNREDAARRGAAATEYMQDWGWPTQVARLLTALREFS